MQIHVTKDGQQNGPYTSEQIQTFLNEGRLLYSDLLWYEGLPDWQPISTVFPPPQQAAPPQQTQILQAAPVQPQAPVRTTPAVPQRPATLSEPVKAKSGKSPLLIICLFVIAPLVIWLGATMAFGLVTKSQVKKDLEKNQMASLGSYKMGLFSSSALTHIHFGEPEEEEGILKLRHKISHGPLMLVNGKPKFAPNHTLTTIDQGKESGKPFPVSMNTEAGFSGALTHSIICESVDEEVEGGYRLTFKGGIIELSSNGDRSEFNGTINISPLQMKSADDNFTFDATTGTLLYQPGGAFEFDADLGAIAFKSTD